MVRKGILVEPALYDENTLIAGVDEIRKYNRHRFDMELLSGILYENTETNCAVGYLDIAERNFWVKGHFPEFPLLPGVLMCESAAQLTGFFANKYNMMSGCILGLGGLDEVRFRGIVRPGDRFVVQVKLLHAKKLLISAEFIGLVRNNIVCEGIVKGMPLSNNSAGLQ
ncbi:beta-hydroxyacyl-ACP dehydratase [Planctomycetales bacterium]|nr:beta-hydroxyacyl-ACP dehydratase [Planctomycetales bacterium]